jgi:NAD(P)-dependent dehydrogenase (short-subunit alcohol dehydrogenase family)
VTARELARRGATVVLVGRNAERSAAAVEQIKNETGNPAVECLLADLSVQADVRRVAEEFKGRYERLHVLINNAGALFLERRETSDGIEMTFALNHLAYFLLTNLLLDRLKASAPARVINVSSAAHWRVTLDFEDLQNRRKYKGFQVYSQSKFANLLFTYELARRLAGTGITVNAVHPGVVASNFGTANGWAGRGIQLLFKVIGLSPEEGAQTVIYLATSLDVERITGKYFIKEKPVASAPASYDEHAATRLWNVSAEMAGLSP